MPTGSGGPNPVGGIGGILTEEGSGAGQVMAERPEDGDKQPTPSAMLVAFVAILSLAGSVIGVSRWRRE
jgi:hypothetical protein